MNLLLDTHAFYWLAEGNPSLSQAAQDAVNDVNNKVFTSVVCAWEVMTKWRLGRAPYFANVAANFIFIARNLHLDVLVMTPDHALLAPSLPWHHTDPFDRLLIAQAIVEGMTIVTRDSEFPKYNIPLLW